MFENHNNFYFFTTIYKHNFRKQLYSKELYVLTIAIQIPVRKKDLIFLRRIEMIPFYKYYFIFIRKND